MRGVEHIKRFSAIRAKWLTLRALRDRQRRTEIELEAGEAINRNLGAEWGGDDPMDVIAAEEQLKRITTLSPKLARAFTAHVIGGQSYAEVAEQEGCDVAAIRKRVQRAKQELESK